MKLFLSLIVCGDAQGNVAVNYQGITLICAILGAGFAVGFITAKLL